MENQKSYYAIIPANVRYSKISPNAKLLYGEITALCNEKGFCWAKNRYFANLYNVKDTTISVWIKQLIKNEFITTEINQKEGNTRKIFLKTSCEKSQDPLRKNRKTSCEKSQDIINNTINTKEREKRKKSLPQPSSKKILNKLNMIATNYHREISEITTSGKTMITPEIRKVLLSALQNFSPLHLLLAIKGFSSEPDQWQMKHNGHKGLEWFFKSSERLSGYIGLFNKNTEKYRKSYIKEAKNYLLK